MVGAMTMMDVLVKDLDKAMPSATATERIPGRLRKFMKDQVEKRAKDETLRPDPPEASTATGEGSTRPARRSVTYTGALST